jgi:CheY-like chemotaxis protein
MRNAQEAARSKESFLANMSHEIRTPLNGIIGMIRELEHETLTGRQRKYVESANIASQHLLSVLNNVLDMSKIEARELVLETRPFNLADTVRDVKRMMNGAARAKQLFLGIAARQVQSSSYIGDAFRIRQVLLNLIGNAIKFTEQGGVFAEAVIEEQRANEHVVRITVEDTGIGIDKDFQANLFRKFIQEDETISRKYGGSGLGMVISRELVHLMNGEITVQSEKGAGTTVSILLTLPLAASSAERPRERKASEDLDGMQVLLVEDNDFNLAVAERSLKRIGCNVTCARNGKEAVDLIASGHQFDAVLMDMQMPVLDGIGATAIIRGELKSRVPVIALTAHAFKAEIDACRAVGMNDYITKPYEEAVMKEVLSLYRREEVHNDKEKTPVEEEKMYDLSALREISGGDQGFVKEMIMLFNQQASLTASEMKEALETEDYKRLAAAAHRIKASVDSLCIQDLRQRIRELEKLASAGNGTAQLRALTAEVTSILEKVSEQLAAQELT